MDNNLSELTKDIFSLNSEYGLIFNRKYREELSTLYTNNVISGMFKTVLVWISESFTPTNLRPGFDNFYTGLFFKLDGDISVEDIFHNPKIEYPIEVPGHINTTISHIGVIMNLNPKPGNNFIIGIKGITNRTYIDITFEINDYAKSDTHSHLIAKALAIKKMIPSKDNWLVAGIL